jgi:cell division protein FtsN
MDPEGGSGLRAAREVRVEGIGLFLLAGALAVLVGGAFWLGYQLGRSGSPAPSASAPLGSGEPVDTSTSAPTPAAANVFDKVEPSGAAAEPKRQAASPPKEAEPPAPVRMAAAPGDWFVQVFAGRDRRAAESVVSALTAQGYPVQLDSSREGRDALYKVRVGGYRDEVGARAAADRLRKEGQSGAWVTRVR